MDDIVSFLQARYDEEYFLAHKFVYVDGGEWTADDMARLWWYGDPPKSRCATDPIIEHVARYNPARTLRRIEQNRAILRRCTGCMDELDIYPNGLVSPRALLARQTIARLAAEFADHPDYQGVWKP